MPTPDVLIQADKLLTDKNSLIYQFKRYPHCNDIYDDLIPKIGSSLVKDYEKAEKLYSYLVEQNDPDYAPLREKVKEYIVYKQDLAKMVLVLNESLEIDINGKKYDKKNPYTQTLGDGTKITRDDFEGMTADMKDMRLAKYMRDSIDQLGKTTNTINGVLKAINYGDLLSSLDIGGDAQLYAELGAFLSCEQPYGSTTGMNTNQKRNKSAYLA